jgi:hypothetical protein
MCPPGVYHVALLARSDARGATRTRVLEHGPVKYDASRFELELVDPAIFIPLPSVHNTIDDIIEFEASLPTKYIIGIRDCRHHVLDLLNYLYV